MVMLTFFSTLSFSSTHNWVINKDHSELQFKVSYLGLSEVSGRFKNFFGHVILDEKELPLEIFIKVDAASLDTANNLRDGHLKGNDFLQTKQFPEIIFLSKSIIPLGKGQFQAKGHLTLRTMTKDFIINFGITSSVKDTWGYNNKFIKFSSKIKRSDFKIKWNKTLADQKYLISDDVSFFGIFQVQPSSAKTPSSKHMLPDTEYVRHREKVFRGEEIAAKLTGPSQGPILETIKSGETKPLFTLPKKSPALDHRESFLWWAALWILGLLGFFSVMIIGFYSKNILIDYFPRKYEENGILGYLSDLVVIFLVLIYSLAFWFVGWGIR